MPGLLIWYLGVFKALALNGMALALYFIALFTYPRHQSQPVIIWFKYETLSAHQLLYSIYTSFKDAVDFPCFSTNNGQHADTPSHKIN